MKLMIVDHPGKIQTLQGLLGEGWRVLSCNPVLDWPKGELGIDLERLTPEYTYAGSGALPAPGSGPRSLTYPDGKRTLDRIRQAVMQGASGPVVLATDPDEEGEALAAHLVLTLPLQESQYQRIDLQQLDAATLNEALKRPRLIDWGRVQARDARRVLDRLVGHWLAPSVVDTLQQDALHGLGHDPVLRLLADRDQEARETAVYTHHNVRLYFESSAGEEWCADWMTRAHLTDNNAFLNDLALARRVANCREVEVVDFLVSEVEEPPPGPCLLDTLLRAAFAERKLTFQDTLTHLRSLYAEGALSFPDGAAAIRSVDPTVMQAGEHPDARWLYDWLRRQEQARQDPAARYAVKRVLLKGHFEGHAFLFWANERTRIEAGWRARMGNFPRSDLDSAPHGAIPALSPGDTFSARHSEVQVERNATIKPYTPVELLDVLQREEALPVERLPAVLERLQTAGLIRERAGRLSITPLGLKIHLPIRQKGFSFLNPYFARAKEQLLQAVTIGVLRYEHAVTASHTILVEEAKNSASVLPTEAVS